MIDPSKIEENMPVLDAGGQPVGRVDALIGSSEIRLAGCNSPHGLHHFIPLDWVAAVDDSVHLKRPATMLMRDGS